MLVYTSYATNNASYHQQAMIFAISQKAIILSSSEGNHEPGRK